MTIGIRREDKNKWERRVPLIPEHVRYLKNKFSIDVLLQPSGIRIFSDEEYIKAGAGIQENLSECPVIFAVKEIPPDFFQANKTYIFFSHTIKGQHHNMPMLKKMMDLKCNLIDYEKIMGEKGQRLIFFGRHAGLAGMLDTLRAFGQRLDWENIPNPFTHVKKTYEYESLEQAKADIVLTGEKISKEGLHEDLVALVCGFTGNGNVSHGAQEIFDLLPVMEIKPKDLKKFMEGSNFSNKFVYKVIFNEEDMVEPVNEKDRFQLQDYYKNPEKYRSVFENYIPYLALLVNGIYWDTMYPRLVTKKYLKNLFEKNALPCLKIIGDISCDIEGSIECTIKTTTPDEPVFVYNPLKDEIIDGYKGAGIVIMAVDNLPCELSREASAFFSETLKDFVPEVLKSDFSRDFESLNLPGSLKKAMIVYHGKLTPDYKYLEKYL